MSDNAVRSLTPDLPLCWVVISAPKGHFPRATHRALFAQLEAIMPKPATVIFLGDGEFDGDDLQADLCRLNWQYVAVLHRTSW
jgi:hypothetical protein